MDELHGAIIMNNAWPAILRSARSGNTFVTPIMARMLIYRLGETLMTDPARTTDPQQEAQTMEKTW